MSLEDIDEKFEKIAKGGLPAPDQKTIASATDTDTDNNYESTFEKRKVTGLLSVFEDHLRKQLEKGKEESDEEFRTVEVNTQETQPMPASKDQFEKVTPEEIESLINISKKPKTDNLKKQATVDNTVYTQKRYDEAHEVQDITASINDPQQARQEVSGATTKYTDNHPTVENHAGANDTQVGLPPVNITKSKSKPSNEVVAAEATQPLETTQPSTQKEVSPDVLKHIQSHRKKKEQDAGLPDNYIKEDKN